MVRPSTSNKTITDMEIQCLPTPTCPSRAYAGPGAAQGRLVEAVGSLSTMALIAQTNYDTELLHKQ